MVYFQVDDILPFHHRVVEAGNAAVGVWVRAGAWSSGHGTDGFIPDAIAKSLGSARELKRLVDSGLWLRGDGGYEFYRWAEDASGGRRQISAREAEERKRKARQRKAAWREGRDGDAVVPRDTTRDDAVNSASLAGAGTFTSTSSPSERSAPDKPASPRSGATRIPEPFIVDAKMRAWAAGETPRVNVDAVTREFVDFWRAAVRDASKKDWIATWRNRMRRVQTELETKGPAPKGDANAWMKLREEGDE